MAKKIILGCLGLAALIMISGSVAAYFFLIRPIMGGLSELEEVSRINARVENRSAFAPPESNELSQNQVERFVNVQDQIRRDLGAHYEALEDKYTEISERLQRDGRDPNFREITGVWRDIMGLIMDAKRAQVDAINNAGFSLDEYHWVRREFYEALGAEFFAVGLDDLAQAAGDRNIDGLQVSRAESQVPERNRELAAPHADSLERWMGFAWWGL